MRRRLVLAIAGVAAAAVLLFAVPLGVVLSHSYRDRELLRLQRDAVAATQQIDIRRVAGDPLEVPRQGAAIGVYDLHGRRIAGRGPARDDALVGRARRTGRPVSASSDGQLVAAAAIIADERVAGVVRAVRSDAAAAHRARDAALAIAGLAAVLVLAAAAAAMLLGGRLARPLERLAAAAGRLGEGDFSVRAPRSSVPEVDAVGSALDATAARLNELVLRERALTADASHQLRTPLTALRVELEALALRDDSPELVAAIAQADRLQATIDTLLAVARDAPRGEETADLLALVDDLERTWRPVLARSARPLRTRVRAAGSVVRARPGVVREILEVLLSNAAVHGEGAVDVVIRDVRGFVAVDVCDEGSGVTAQGDGIFARRAGSGEGHGIGLALARSLAHAEGGRLALGDTGPRTTFTLTLVAADVASPAPVDSAG